MVNSNTASLHEHYMDITTFRAASRRTRPPPVTDAGSCMSRQPTRRCGILSQISTLGGKIWKIGISNSMTYRPPNSRKSKFATELSCSPGAPRPMKKNRPFSVPRQHSTMRSKGLVARSCSDWCPEPATELDLDTCRHHELLPASSGKSSTQGSLSSSGCPASPSVEGGVAWT